MRNLQIIGNVPQARKENNFGEYAEEAVIIEEQPKVKKENPHFLEANTLEVTMQHLKEDCITPVFAKDNELTIPHPAFIDNVTYTNIGLINTFTTEKRICSVINSINTVSYTHLDVYKRQT